MTDQPRRLRDEAYIGAPQFWSHRPLELGYKLRLLSDAITPHGPSLFQYQLQGCL